MSKLGMLAAGAVGYVLGARAGRERYDQIAYQAQRFWTSPKVQRVASEAQVRVREAAPVVAEKVGDAAKTAAGAAVSVVKRDDGDDDSSNDGENTGTRRSTSNGSNAEPKVSHL